MPRDRRPKPIYQRGPYRLHAREGRNHEIIWYDERAKRERSRSAGSACDDEAKTALDRFYLSELGDDAKGAPCPHCGRPMVDDSRFVADIIADYMIDHASTRVSEDIIRHRLNHVVRYLPTIPEAKRRADRVNDKWIDNFRAWLEAEPYERNGVEAYRSPATIENSVLQLAAALRWEGLQPKFKTRKLAELSRSPAFRADIETMAKMFRYALKSKRRSHLLGFLRMSVATWGRPEAILEASTAPKRKQWYSAARVFALNPIGRAQTKKYRATVPIPEPVGEWLDGLDGMIVPTFSRSTWYRMARGLGLPGDGEAGYKLIRRSMATLARQPEHLGEESWIQGRIMLGHVQPTTSDIYALQNPANLGKVLAFNSWVVDEIEKRAPGAFYRDLTALGDNVVSINGPKNG